MKELNSIEARYFILLLASEESSLIEVVSELTSRNVSRGVYKEALKELLSSSVIGLHKINTGNLYEYSKSECLNIISRIDSSIEPAIQLHLTEIGFERFDNDDFGISIKRAREILFK